ncbi:hypothetical protein GJ496_009586 [Pomphorhynchus laevis]|nr:hypothetical protein GJ496_009586 [Pomphorhynchus laevis]
MTTNISTISSNSTSNGTDSTIVCSESRFDHDHKYLLNTPTPSYLSNRTSMESFDSNDLPSVHSEVASEYSTVLSAIDTASCAYSSVSTRRPLCNNTIDYYKHGNIEEVCYQSEEDDIVNFAAKFADDKLTNVMIDSSLPLPNNLSTRSYANMESTRYKDRMTALSPISISTDDRVSLRCTQVNRELKCKDDMDSGKRNKLDLLDNHRTLPYMSYTQLNYMNKHGHCHPETVSSNEQILNHSRNNLLNKSNMSCKNSTIEITSDQTFSKFPTNFQRSEFEESDHRKRRKESFKPLMTKTLSIDDLSVHSFKMRRLKNVVSHQRVPDVETQSPPTTTYTSEPMSEIRSLDDSEQSNLDNCSLLVSSGDSSHDDAILSLSIAKTYASNRYVQQSHLHCPTPMTNISHSPSPLSSLDKSKFEESSEDNSSKDDELLGVLNTLAFSGTTEYIKNECSSRSSILTQSTCLSAKPSKKVRFDNDPIYIKDEQLTKSTLYPIIRHTRSSQLREQYIKRKNQLIDQQASDIQRHAFSSSSSSIRSLPTKCARK